jgi:hypothetical protein
MDIQTRICGTILVGDLADREYGRWARRAPLY